MCGVEVLTYGIDLPAVAFEYGAVGVAVLPAAVEAAASADVFDDDGARRDDGATEFEA